MKKLAILLFMAVAFFSSMQIAAADTVTYLGGTYQTGGGGEFTMRPLPIPGTLSGFLNNYAEGVTRNISGFSNTFQTFCIEWDENISGGGVYNAVLNTKAVQGGAGPGENPDPISKGTAWLYSQFAAGALANYNFLGTEAERKASADALQKAIWFLEHEESVGVNNSFVTAAIAAVAAGGGNAYDDANGAYGVMALNLYNSDGSRAQDVLIKTPEPLTLLLLGLGLLGVAGIRRKLS